jgi:hypothetical protein
VERVGRQLPVTLAQAHQRCAALAAGEVAR